MEKVLEAGVEIIVKNAEGDPDTKATIIHQNNIDYEPKVSVIIPVYNTEEYLRECLDSVVNQTLKEIEIICVDDGSTDSSPEILNEYAQKDNRITIITQENLYAGVARNAGLAIAKGVYLSFLDSDDYIKLEYLEKLYNKIIFEKADICICKRYLLDSRTNTIKEDDKSLKMNLLPMKTTFSINDIYFNLFQFCEIAVWMKMYSRKFLQLNNIFFQNTKTINDVYFNHVSLMLANSITCIDDFLIIYRFFNDSSLTSSRGKDVNTLLKIYKKIIDLSKKKNIFHKIEQSLYERLMRSARYELSLCKDWNKKKEMEKALIKFFPKKYRLNFIKNKSLKWYQYLLSIKNDDKYKRIRILGAKINLKKKQLPVASSNIIVNKNVSNNVKNKATTNNIKENKTQTKNVVQGKELDKNIQKLNYVNFQELAGIIRKNITKIPQDIDLIVGIPRSGIIPAYMLGLFLNKRVCSLNEFLNDITPGNGFRTIKEKSNKIKNVLFVDDSVRSGSALKATKEKLSNYKNIGKYNIKFLAIIAKQEATELVDYYFEIIEPPRLFNWNYLNHSIAQKCCYDIDGVLCEDPTDEQNDDGKKYIDFIRNARPLYIPAYKIKAIVTSRLEKYRKETEKWLAKHNVEYEKLYMLDMKTAEERRQARCHASFKASVYKSIYDSELFIESNSRQAKKIYELTGKPVICVETDVMYK